ncbi:zinc finger BED domain-containing protein RICESLEEPER 2-like [Nymphaea colorata]|uniref:zinc finger BED domain-containing protein RICESLEEPER 2-like n=1 Tax=Nymphaea colorata TaxID=210225 RepID=UPI00129E5A47|nr:zinc finger BED domain-containing protein RICESLEEPER 2-like [Nymphaea colorata]
MVQDGLSAIRDELGKIREAVKYIKCSPSRLYNFQVIVDEFEMRGQKKLVLDVSTRWNSTYLMLEVALMYRHVFDRYAMEDVGSKYPTTNLFFLEIWGVQELLQEGVTNGSSFMKRMTFKMKEKFDKYWSSCNILMAIASILDPRIKLSLTDFVFSKTFCQIEEKEEHMTLVRSTMQDLYNSYIAKIDGSNKDVESDSTTFMRGTDPSCGNSSRSRIRFLSFLNKADNVHFQASKSELDMYLEDGLLKCDVTAHDSFDILIWWKDKELKYPILSHMARDILCIPITTVAFESAFSTGGRIVDESRSSLSPKTVEELVCAGDWIKQYGDPMNLVPGTAEDEIA